MRHNFKSSLEVGQRGEEWLMSVWPELERLDGRKSDFKLPDGTLVEVKTDSYPMSKTPNFFMERYSDTFKGTPGGPWQALGHNSTLFVYVFSADKTAFIFDTKKLVEALEPLILNMTPKIIKNARWETLGYTVPRDAISHLYEKKEFK